MVGPPWNNVWFNGCPRWNDFVFCTWYFFSNPNPNRNPINPNRSIYFESQGRATSGRSSHPIITRSSGASAPNVVDPTSTPVSSQSSDPLPEGQFVMPQTPEQLVELFSRRLAAVTSAAQSPSLTPSKLYDPSGLNSQYENQPQPAKLQEVPQTSYRNTTSVSCDTLKANRLTENGNDNAKRRDIILKVLKTEDLLTLVNGRRIKPYATPENPSGYYPRSITYESGEKLILSADDV